MSARRLLGALAALLLLVPAGALANGNGGRAEYKVTGGGQVIASTDGGPGDTIAFNAQGFTDREAQGETEDEEDSIYPARGQLQVINRWDADAEERVRGRDQARFHGTVTCIVPRNGSTARFGGTGWDQSNKEVFDFVVDVTDGDRGEDEILFQRLAHDEDENPCRDEAATELRDVQLSRGNVTIHDRRDS